MRQGMQTQQAVYCSCEHQLSILRSEGEQCRIDRPWLTGWKR